jgi:thiol-disulfide isomerase/thioredoxin
MNRDTHEMPGQQQQRSAAPGAIVVLVISAVVLLVVARARQPHPPNEWAGRPLPPLEVAGWLNADTDLAADDLQGKVVLLDFWMTSCGPCVASLPDLASLRERFRERGLMVVGLTPDPVTDERFTRLVEDTPGMDWPVGYGADAVFGTMGIFAVPTYVVYDRAGRSTWGGHSLDDAEDAIIEALAKPTSAAEVE